MQGGREGDRGRGAVPARFPTTLHTSQNKVKMETVCGMLFPLSPFSTENYTVLLKLLTVYSLLTHKETFTTIIQHALNTCPYALPYPNGNANNTHLVSPK